MDSELVSAGIGLAGAVIGAVAGYFGSIGGAKLQIEEERKRLSEENIERQTEVEEQKKLYKDAINNFLRNEIQDNFRSCFLYEGKRVQEWLNNREYKFSYDFSERVLNLQFDEFNKLKYELLKLEVSKSQEIIKIYDMFYLIRRKQNIDNFTHSEYIQFRKAYKICFEKYYEG